jgi:NAD(P)-dependent dehydrogenase (short-subunit alcohol dehydrogenase family)
MSTNGDRKSIFITGAGSGIGRATAKHFAAQGWYCGLYDISSEGIAETGAMLPQGRFTTGVFDVRDRNGWSDAVAKFADCTGDRMNVLFNNAGVGRHGWFEDVTGEDNDWIIDVNLKGVVNGVQAALPLLERTPGARVVNVASAAGIYGSPRLAVYSATKFAVRGLTEALDLEFERKGIKVTSLMPYFIDTPILNMATNTTSNHSMKEDIKASGSNVYPVELAAQRAWDAAHGTELHYTVGKDADRARFAARWMPKTLRKQIASTLMD